MMELIQHVTAPGPAVIMIDGKPVRSYAKRCKCGFMDAVIINIIKGSTPRDQETQAERIIKRKFEAKGWEIGKNDLCPDCVRRRDFAPKKKETAVAPQKNGHDAAPKDWSVNHEPMVATPETSINSDAAFKPSFVERQIILAKLMDIYVSETVGYSPGWTDARVATDLGVSRLWVAQLRDENFGPSGSNPEIDEAIKQGQALLRDLDAQLREIKDWKEKLEDWKKRTLEKFDTQIAEVNGVISKYDGNVRDLRGKLDAITKAVKPIN